MREGPPRATQRKSEGGRVRRAGRAGGLGPPSHSNPNSWNASPGGERPPEERGGAKPQPITLRGEGANE